MVSANGGCNGRAGGGEGEETFGIVGVGSGNVWSWYGLNTKEEVKWVAGVT